jgi:hypothetical protein
VENYRLPPQTTRMIICMTTSFHLAMDRAFRVLHQLYPSSLSVGVISAVVCWAPHAHLEPSRRHCHYIKTIFKGDLHVGDNLGVCRCQHPATRLKGLNGLDITIPNSAFLPPDHQLYSDKALSDRAVHHAARVNSSSWTMPSAHTSLVTDRSEELYKRESAGRHRYDSILGSDPRNPTMPAPVIDIIEQLTQGTQWAQGHMQMMMALKRLVSIVSLCPVS